MIIAGKFQTYDYGYFNNYKHYGQATPIMYDLKKVIAPLAIFYSADDILTPKSVRSLLIIKIYKNIFFI